LGSLGKDRSFKSLADLKGLKIGVTAANNSSSHFFVLYLMAMAGLAPGDGSFVGVGGGQEERIPQGMGDPPG
jgi:NitT/TauT family transport system substrate-binding protein